MSAEQVLRCLVIQQMKRLYPELAYRLDESVRRDHTICVAAGSSGFVMDCMVLDGTPCDTTLTVTSVERVAALRNRGVPKQVAFDSGFVSRANADSLKALGVVDIGFPKKNGLDTTDLVKSN